MRLTVTRDRARSETKEKDAAEERLGYHETVEKLHQSFAWKPAAPAALLVKALSKVMRPLEHGTYGGRTLAGGPHRSSWVIASPLSVFVLPEKGYRHRVFLAARLRNTGPINIIEEAPGTASPGRKQRKERDKAKEAGRQADGGARGAEGLDRKRPGRELEALVALQHESDVAVTVVPLVRAYHQMTPDAPAATMAARAYRLHPLHLLRKTTNWARTARTGRVKNCTPLVLSRWLEETPPGEIGSQAAALRLRLNGDIESERRACTGPPLPSNREVKRRVLADPVLNAYMQTYALEQGVTREAVIGEARGQIDEIASDYRVGVARYFCRAVDYAFDRLVDEVEVDREGIRFLSECDNRSRIVLVCSHKSYLDPLLIGYTLFRSGLVPPQQAAGLNLNIWPIGWLLRHSGAFYLRRTFTGETLYKEVFCAYVRYLLAENYTSVVYIEGTRSRDGKQQKPKTGYLGILADSLRMGVCGDITLVPVYLGYDKVPEESAHVREMAGGRKVSESVKGFARIYKSINTRLGRAYVKFGTPMSMKALLDEHGLKGTAEIATEGINRVTPVTARSLASCALLAPGGDWVSAGELERAADELLRFCERRRLPLAVDGDPGGVGRAVEWLASEGHVTPERRGEEDGFKVAGSGRRFLEYNKNIQLGHFLEPALSAVIERSSSGSDDGARENADAFLRKLFDQEFTFSPDRVGETWKLDYQAYADVLSSLLDSYLEAYLAACLTAGSLEPGVPVPADEVVEMCFGTAEKMLEEGLVRREESPCRVAFKSALRSFRDMGLLEERREARGDGRDSVAYLSGERFDEVNEVADRIRSFLPRG